MKFTTVAEVALNWIWNIVMHIEDSNKFLKKLKWIQFAVYPVWNGGQKALYRGQCDCLHLIILYIPSIERIRRTEVGISWITSTECYSWHYVNRRPRRCFSYTSHDDINSEIFEHCSRWIIYQEGVKNTAQFIGWFLCTIKLLQTHRNKLELAQELLWLTAIRQLCRI